MQKDKQWCGGCDDLGAGSYTPAVIDAVRDLNGDARSEAVIVEGSVYRYGDPGQGLWLVSQQADGEPMVLPASSAPGGE